METVLNWDGFFFEIYYSALKFIHIIDKSEIML